ncbi:MAG TPA: WXG100 family type VII secretion target [Actinocrinis sp.]|jgi:WXG100 family type VII secretion target
MTTYTVNMSNVAAVAEEMGSIAQYIQGLLDDLDNSSKMNLAEWTSNARDAYNVAKAKWDAAAAQMVVQANNAQNSLGQINDSYAQAEYQGLGLWGQ